MASIMLVLSSEEVQRTIPYALICETMYGATWETGTRRRRWAAEFTESERNACYKLRAQAHRWYLSTGIPDEVTMALSTMNLWQKLGAFCASL